MEQEHYTRFLETYNKKNFGLRLSAIRSKKGVSARRMSLDLGQNKNYINSIESGNHFPAMQVFFEICFYLNISPAEFFMEKKEEDSDENNVTALLYQLPPHVFQHLSQIIYDFIENSVY